MSVLPRSATFSYDWESVPWNHPTYDEDYVLRVGDYLATVSTRAECTAWAIYQGDYATTGTQIASNVVAVDHIEYDHEENPIRESWEPAEIAALSAAEDALSALLKQPPPIRRPVGPCPCECNRGGFCGGCGHAGCGGRR